jgi:hypothetical protein
MGNIWGSEKIRPTNGTYLNERRVGLPVRKKKRVLLQELPLPPALILLQPLEEPLLLATEKEAPAPKEHWKVKALRIFHHLAEKSRATNRGMLLQTEG